MKYGEKLFSQTEEMYLAKKERTWCNMEGPSAASERTVVGETLKGVEAVH